MKDFITVTSSALPDSTRVGGFRGTEGISRPYEFEVFLLVGAEGKDLDLADAVGAKAKLALDRDDGSPPFVFHGIFAAFELLAEYADHSVFHATLVPQLWQLTQTLHSRIFTQMSIPDILKEVLEDGGLSSSDYELKLSGSYKTEEHVCQYQESHLDFISRWMEREGMYYYFEQGDDAEKLVITDSKSFQAPLPPKAVRFYPISGHDVTAGPALHTLTCKHRSLPASVRLKDYDYTKPTLDVSGSAPVSKVGIGEISVYGRRFFSPDDGKRIAKVRAEELLARQVTYRGSGTTLYLRSGYFFTLEEHPRPAFDMEYLVTEVEHVGNQALFDATMAALTGIEGDRVYWVEVTAIPGSVQFRPESRTAWPRIYGFENGTVCGPAESEYAQIDDDGRYNVKFKFDESDLKDGKASTWVRMMQPHGGSPEGFHFPLRKATEVIFSFLGGDPDRPVISGVVPNTHNPSPVVKSNHTLNVVQTGGRNRWELDDQANQQRITMLTPHENTFFRMGYPLEGHTLVMQTNKATLLNAGADLDVLVGQINSGGSWDSTIKTNWTSCVQDGGFTLSVGTGILPASAGKIDVKSTSDITITTTTGDYGLYVIAGTSTTEIKGDTMLTVDAGAFTQTVTGGDTLIDNTSSKTTVTSMGKVTVQSTSDGLELLAQDAWHGKSATSDVLIEAPSGNITLSTPGQTITVDCTTFTDKSTTHKSWYGQHSAFSTGKWSVLKSGDWLDVGLSAGISIQAAIKLALSFSLSLEGSFGLKISNYVGPAEIKLGNVKLDNINGVWMKKAAAKIESVMGPKLARRGVYVAA